MIKRKKQKTVTQEEQINGNIVVVALGCKQCPPNKEYRVLSREESDLIASQTGKVIECPECHGRWLLRRVQICGTIWDTKQKKQEWRVAPLFVPILSSFDINTLNIMDVPISMIEDKEDGQNKSD
ncbi:MAG: hypothetical protein V2A70_01360 [Candidatus Omnitrophota bacterium]